MLKIGKTGVSTSKRVYLWVFLSAWAFWFSVSRSVLLGPRLALKMAKTAKRAITSSVPRHTANWNFWQNFWTCPNRKTAVPEVPPTNVKCLRKTKQNFIKVCNEETSSVWWLRFVYIMKTVTERLHRHYRKQLLYILTSMFQGWLHLGKWKHQLCVSFLNYLNIKN